MGNGATLPTKIIRNGYIKFPEQGLVIALSLYKAASSANCKMSLGSRVIDGTATPVMIWEAKLPCAVSVYKSGKPYESLAAIVKANQFPPSPLPTAPSSITYPIPDEPTSVNTHEKYLLWVAQTIEGLADDSELVKVTFDATGTTAFIVINASLPYDATIFSTGGNLFEAVEQVVSVPPEVSIPVKWNSDNKYFSISTSDDDLIAYLGTNTEGGILANVGVAPGKKKYWEILLGDAVAFNVGFAPSTHDVQASSIVDSYVIGGGKVKSLGVDGSAATLVAGQTVGIALDMTTGTANFYLIGNTTTTLAVSGIDTSKTWMPCLLGTGSNPSSSWGTIKPKASQFIGTLPTGYTALEAE